MKAMGFGCLVLVFALGLMACQDALPPQPAACATDPDCKPEERCVLGYCWPRCVSSTDCPDGQACVSGACLRTCQGPDDCPAGQECRLGHCLPVEQPDGGDGADADADGGGGACIDLDQDGFGQNCLAGPDCDDSDPLVNPRMPEICDNGKDDNCDGRTDEAECGCRPGTRSSCYDGPPGTRNRGVCRAGMATCLADRTWGPCLGQQVPPEWPEETSCDGLDNDCDGEIDEDLLNRCGACAPPDSQLMELCGNGLDDDCDGEIDEGCDCDPNCQCEDPGAGTGCICRPPTNQVCYSGPPPTLGFGLCRGGLHDCVERPDGTWGWSECRGEVLPAPECPGGGPDGLDNDCDGRIDEDCPPDRDGDGYAPPEDCDDTDPTIFPGAVEVCNGRDDNCNGVVDEGVANACGGCGPVPAEVCGDGIDNNCDGQVDEGCGGCSGGQSRPCYVGPGGAPDVGVCRWGEQTCDGEFWSECVGSVGPSVEICDGLDNDCDGETDERWALGSNACGFCDGEEICDGLDNNCDGQTDEGLRNACGDCLPVPEETECNGLDDDCDGLTDEGLLNACGTCGDSCYEGTFGGASDWPLGRSDGVSNAVEPDELRLDSQTLSPHFIWIAGTNIACTPANGCLSDPPCYPGRTCHTVKKYDTHTNQLVGVYSSWGWSSSRTAVAVDNSVWVGNRGCEDNLSNCQGQDPTQGNAAHLDADGNLLCVAEAVGSNGGVAVRAVTIDKNGDAWLGSWSLARMYKYSGTQVDNSNPDGIPRCVRLCEVNLADGQGTSRAYGAAVDANGYLWIATLGSGPLRKINTATCQLEATVATTYQTYGIAIDKNNNPWYGCWDSGCACGAVMVNAATHTIQCIGRSVGNTSGGQTRGVAADLDGNMWVSEWSHTTVSKFSPAGAHLGQWSIQGQGYSPTGPLGMAVDFDNNIWAVGYSSGHASKFAADGTLLSVFPIGPGASAYSYSDMTGYQLRTITLKQGSWTLDYDSGYADARWDRIEWSGSLGADDQIRVRAASAAAQGSLPGPSNPAGWTPYHDAQFGVPPPWSADIRGQVQDNRWLRVEVMLTTQDDVSPAFTGLRVLWQR
jgi:streptogramin lyase